MWTPVLVRQLSDNLPEESSRPLNPNRQPVVPRPGRHRRPMTAPKPQTEKNSKRKKIWLTILTVLVVLAILAIAGYFFKVLILSKYYFCKRSVKFIPIDLACDGKHDCAGGEDELTCVSALTVNSTFPVRLLSAKSVLQVFKPGMGWRSVCSNGWTAEHTQTACKQMGYASNPRSGTVPISSLPKPFANGPFTTVRSESGKTPVHQAASTSTHVCQSGSVVTLSCSDCGQARSKERIVGGTDADIEDWPWQVSLLQGGKHVCGGALVTPQWVVTAAHCFGGKKDIGRWKVVSGQTFLGAQTGSSVTNIITNGQYDEASNDYDLAMMKLYSPLYVGDTCRPVCLPPKNLGLRGGAMLTVTGWGYLEENGEVSNRLQEASIPLIDRTTCSNPSVYYDHLTERMICAGFLKGGVDACQGDSGGPLVHLTMSKNYLVGVVSWGVGCARRGKPGVYTNVEEMMNWINTVIQKYP